VWGWALPCPLAGSWAWVLGLRACAYARACMSEQQGGLQRGPPSLEGEGGVPGAPAHSIVSSHECARADLLRVLVVASCHSQRRKSPKEWGRGRGWGGWEEATLLAGPRRLASPRVPIVVPWGLGVRSTKTTGGTRPQLVTFTQNVERFQAEGSFPCGQGSTEAGNGHPDRLLEGLFPKNMGSWFGYGVFPVLGTSATSTTSWQCARALGFKETMVRAPA
jgi:hypothetical protein